MEKPIGYLNGELVGTVGFGGIALNSGGVIFIQVQKITNLMQLKNLQEKFYGVMKWKQRYSTTNNLFYKWKTICKFFTGVSK